MREERERRNLENERYQLSRDLERVESELPYEAECLLLTQTIQYLRKIIEEPAANGVEKEQTEEVVDESVSEKNVSWSTEFRRLVQLKCDDWYNVRAHFCSWQVPFCRRASGRRSFSTPRSRRVNTERTMRRRRRSPRR